MRVYISGAITGRPTKVYLRQFADAESKLFDEGYEVINPAEVCFPLPDTLTHDDYMDICKLLLSKCDAIYMLEGWQDSSGAKEEFEIANRLGLYVMGDAEPIKRNDLTGKVFITKNDHGGHFAKGTRVVVILDMTDRASDRKSLRVRVEGGTLEDWYSIEDLEEV